VTSALTANNSSHCALKRVRRRTVEIEEERDGEEMKKEERGEGRRGGGREWLV
jgi:hypothetical protein